MPGKLPLVLDNNGGLQQLQSNDYLIGSSAAAAAVSNIKFGTPIVKSSTVSITNASPADITWTNHGLSAGMPVIFTTTGTLPSGINLHQVYYVIAAGLTTNAFRISATAGGSAVNTSSAGSGTHTVMAGIIIPLKNMAGNDFSAADPAKVTFRSPTLTDGSCVERTISAPLSIHLPAGSALAGGLVACRLWFVLLDDGGTIRLGVVNCIGTQVGYQALSFVTSVFALRDDEIYSSTILNDAADASGVIYSPVAVTSKASRVIGYVEWTAAQAVVAGWWTAAPAKMQMWHPGVGLPGEEVQRQIDYNATMTTGTTTIPADNTPPQNTEGDQYFSKSITPRSGANYYEVSYDVLFSPPGGAFYIGIFKNNIANCLFGDWENVNNVGSPRARKWLIRVDDPNITTFKLRAGSHVGGTVTLNGYNGSQFYGDTGLPGGATVTSALTIIEREG